MCGMRLFTLSGAVLLTALLSTPVRAGFLILPDLTTGGIPSNFPTDTPPNETADKAFDNDASTKGLVFNDVANDNTTPYEDVTAANPVSWAYQLTAPATVQSYSLTSANDDQNRDPRDFFLEGSPDGSAWTIVDTVTNHVFLDQPGVGDNSVNTNRFETYFFTVDTPGSYLHYRLRLIETFGTTNDRPQIAEIQLFDTVVPEPASTAVFLLAGGASLALRRRRPQ